MMSVCVREACVHGFKNKNTHADDDGARGVELRLVDGDKRTEKVVDEERGMTENTLLDREYKGEMTKEDDKKEEEEEGDSRMGLDRGYAWFVVLGSFVSWVLVDGYLRSAGILFLQFQNHFKTGALLAAWPGSIMFLLQNLSAPLMAIVCNRYSVRTCVIIGTAMTFVGLLLNFLVDNFYFLFFCYSILQGPGLGFVLSPSMFIVTDYFDKHRGFAISLGSAGGGMGSFVIVPLVTFLFDVYGFHGCFLILAGILCNGFVVAMLYRPLRVHQRYLVVRRKKENQTLCSNGHLEQQDGNAAYIPLKEKSSNIATSSPSPSSSSSSPPPLPELHYKTSTFCLQIKSSLKICFPTERKKTLKRKIFHYELFKDFSFLLYFVSTFFAIVALQGILMFIPAACVDKGLSETDAALILSISGAVDTVVRIGCGIAFDLPRLKPHRVAIFNALVYCMALCGFLIPLLHTFGDFALVCTMFGSFFGAHIAQRPVVMVDLMGKEVLPSCMGIIRIAQGFGILTGSLLFGFLRDVMGNYDIAFYTGGSLLVLAGLVMTCSILSYKSHHRKTRQRQQQRGEQSQLYTQDQ